MTSEVSLEGYAPQDIANLASLSAKLMQDPNTRKDFLKVLKKQNPQFSAPELEMDTIADQVSKQVEEKLAAQGKSFEEIRKELSDRDARERERDAREKWNELRMAPVKEGLIKEGEINDLEEFMKKEGYNSTQYLQAARYKNAMSQLAPPTPAPLTAFQMPDNAELQKNPKKYFREQMLAGLNESRVRKATGTFGQA